MLKNRKLLIGICCVLAGYSIYGWQRQESRKNDGFELGKITTQIPNEPQWNVPSAPTHLYLLLQQPFRYLGHGLQFYAFESSDGMYVLKFLRHQRLRPNMVINALPDIAPFSYLKEYKQKECEKRIGYIFRSLLVAYQDVPEETGLLYVHLNKTKNLYPTVELKDKVNTTYHVSLDDTEFVLQRKATLVKPTLIQLMQQKKVAEAKCRIEQIFTLLKECAKKGVCDTDNQLIRKDNLGFIADRAIYIDTGKLTRKASIKTKERFSQDLQRLEPLYEWLKASYPELAAHFAIEKRKTLDNF